MRKFTESIKFGKYELDDSRVIYKDDNFYIIFDQYPVSPGHLIIISNGKEVDYFSLSQSKKDLLSKMILKGKDIIEKDHSPDGYNIGMNCGESAGQTVMQFHCHLIPRYKGDVENPKGGVRHSVIGKGYYNP
jgi:diadenosine tetraphosphate (Ap4A) HIT family hydrolase